MANDGISISLGAVAKSASTIRNLNTSLNSRLDEIKKEMGNLSSTWQSDASNTIRNNFNALAPRFEEYQKVIESYAKFLDNTVANYEAAENAINSNASAFK
ncbi:pore-forming ESAT-6 family protein [Cohnella cholangitidis]|uniref:ESAT-6-like protein n=1 Tax=Cohnella cholangitidis TaxID=2598458 RepID=A0A7G5BU53_9BACL|nr:pore-forming ESAT-6 family protein [Cohnella cholangitidis]QMV40487.1 WXG100 family type VII secretion target [Cohnella cholangitidis]